MKHNHDYDSVFKTLKFKHKRLFIPVINNVFGMNFPLDADVVVLPSDGFLDEGETVDGSAKLTGRESDFLIRIEGHTFLIECQSYDDGSMAIRIAKYAVTYSRQPSALAADGVRKTWPAAAGALECAKHLRPLRNCSVTF